MCVSKLPFVKSGHIVRYVSWSLTIGLFLVMTNLKHLRHSTAMTHVKSAPYHPFTNSLAECAIQILQEIYDIIT